MGSLRRTSTERRQEVYRIISDGSDPRPAFFLFVALSTLIAAFGLLMDSTAVVIGAMLVAPLMTPILGLALALVRGDARLLGYSLRSEVLGLVAAIVTAMLLGAAVPYYSATAEMLSRTQPNLFDLSVAVLAGLAGAYALVDERLSPMLPGVAISTAIVPPLANVGLCISLGAFQGAWGSFLLFFTNFLSILLVSSIVFWWAGMSDTVGMPSKKTVAKRFGLAATGFVVLGALLGRELLNLIDSQRLARDVREVLEVELAEFRVTEISHIFQWRDDDRVQVRARVHAPVVIRPRQVEVVEERLSKALGTDVTLYLRSTMTRDVSSDGAISMSRTLDGFFLSSDAIDSETEVLIAAEQAVREFLDNRFGFALEGITMFSRGETVGIYAHIAGGRRLYPAEITELKDLIQSRVEPPITLAIAEEALHFVLENAGRLRPEFVSPAPLDPEIAEKIQEVRDFGHTYLKQAGFNPLGISIVPLEDGFHALFEVAGPEVFEPEDYDALRDALKNQCDFEAELYVHSEVSALLSKTGYRVPTEVFESYLERVRGAYAEQTRKVLEETR